MILLLKIYKSLFFIIMFVYYAFVDKRKVHEIIQDDTFKDIVDFFCYSFYAYMVYVKVFIEKMSFDDLCHNLFLVLGGIGTIARIFYTANIKRVENNTKEIENKIKEEELKNIEAVNKFQKEVFDEARK